MTGGGVFLLSGRGCQCYGGGGVFECCIVRNDHKVWRAHLHLTDYCALVTILKTDPNLDLDCMAKSDPSKCAKSTHNQPKPPHTPPERSIFMITKHVLTKM